MGIASMMIPMIMTIDHGPSPRMFSMMSRIHTTSCGSTVSVWCSKILGYDMTSSVDGSVVG